MFEEQKKVAEESIKNDELAHIVDELKKRLKYKKDYERKIEQVNKEIDKLVKDGVLDNLNDYIKIDSQQDNTGLHINLVN